MGSRKFFPREKSKNVPDIFPLKSDCMATLDRAGIEVALSLKPACLLKNREKFLRAKKTSSDIPFRSKKKLKPALVKMNGSELGKVFESL